MSFERLFAPTPPLRSGSSRRWAAGAVALAEGSNGTARSRSLAPAWRDGASRAARARFGRRLAVPDGMSWTPRALGAEIEGLVGTTLTVRPAPACRLRRRRVSAAHGFLPPSSSPPLAARGRAGGDVAGRSRFVRAILRAIRARCGAGVAIGLKRPADDFVPVDGRKRGAARTRAPQPRAVAGAAGRRGSGRHRRDRPHPGAAHRRGYPGRRRCRPGDAGASVARHAEGRAAGGPQRGAATRRRGRRRHGRAAGRRRRGGTQASGHAARHLARRGRGAACQAAGLRRLRTRRRAPGRTRRGGGRGDPARRPGQRGRCWRWRRRPWCWRPVPRWRRRRASIRHETCAVSSRLCWPTPGGEAGARCSSTSTERPRPMTQPNCWRRVSTRCCWPCRATPSRATRRCSLHRAS